MSVHGDEFSRAELLLGREAVTRLAGSHVAVFGVGGVGAACVEALARGGVGELSLFDNDVVSVSNINRQFVALHSTIGRRKVDVMRDRVLDVNPDAVVHANCCFYDASTAPGIPLAFDYIVDCIDTVTSKLLLIESAHAQGVPIISALGAGNKLDPSRFRAADIYETSVCPLARVMRSQLRKRGIAAHRVVYSTEPPHAGGYRRKRPSPARQRILCSARCRYDSGGGGYSKPGGRLSGGGMRAACGRARAAGAAECA